jgi:rubrerythrin
LLVVERSSIDAYEAAGYVECVAAGEAAVGEYHCSECGYGVAVQRVLPLCPMCGGTVWEAAAWQPFALGQAPAWR